MILITGGGGFIGMNLAWRLANEGQEAVLLQRSPYQVPAFMEPFWDKKVKGIKGDVQNLPFLIDLIKENKVESIIHLAGAYEAKGGTVLLNDVISINIGGTVNVFEAARLLNLRRVTFASSNTVYMSSKELPKGGLFNEDVNLPVLDFGYIACTKKACEQIALLYTKKYNMSICLIRGGRGYGPLSNTPGPVEVMVKSAMEGKPATINTPENVHLAPVYIKDLARGYSLLHLAKSLKHYIYNISSGHSYPLSEVAQMVKELFPGAETHLGAAAPNVIFCPDISRSREEVGYVPEYPDLKVGIAAYIDFIKKGKY